jgi:hypothetical protein
MIAYTSRMYVRGFTWTAAIRLAEVHWLVGHWQDALRVLSEQVEGGDLRGGMSGLWARTLRSRMWIDVGLVSPARDLLCEDLANVMATGEIQTIGPHSTGATLPWRPGRAGHDREPTTIDRNPYLERDSVPALGACRARETAMTWPPKRPRPGSRPERAEQQMRSRRPMPPLIAVGVLASARSPERALEPLRTQ